MSTQPCRIQKSLAKLQDRVLYYPRKALKINTGRSAHISAPLVDTEKRSNPLSLAAQHSHNLVCGLTWIFILKSNPFSLYLKMNLHKQKVEHGSLIITLGRRSCQASGKQYRSLLLELKEVMAFKLFVQPQY